MKKNTDGSASRDLPINLKLPDDFLKEEVRCGYTIVPKLKKIWAVELDLLVEFMRVCQKYDLKFHVAYGTMIGAVRHQGFIPWDDDVDVWMPRTDYDRLAKVAPKEFKHPYFLQTALSDPKYFFGAFRLRNSLTTAAIHGFDSADYNNGIFIDILPLDCPPEGKWNDFLSIKLMQFAIRGASLCKREFFGNTPTRRFITRLVRPFARIIPYEWWVHFYDWTLRRHSKNSSVMGPIFSIAKKERCIRVRKSDFKHARWVPFEFIKVPIPADYDAVLRPYYGDYMTYPPESERGAWHEGQIRFDPETPYNGN